jgi:hypothetical protein
MKPTKEDMSQAVLKLAVIAAFHRNDWCPGTKFSEVLDQEGAFKAIIDNAKVQAYWAGYPNFIIDIYTVAEILWDMTYREVQNELDECEDIPAEDKELAE